MNPLYWTVKLILATLYPAYASFKAVKEKNVKEYVKWMMYWIVFAGFTAIETITDTFLSFWFPFYYESKLVVLLWLLSPATRGSSLLYRRFIHPALIKRENDIDNMMRQIQEHGYRTMASWSRTIFQYITTAIMQTAIQGGGGIIQHLKTSYSLTDIARIENLPTIDRRLRGRGTKQLTQDNQRQQLMSEKCDKPMKKVEIYFPEVDSSSLYEDCREKNAAIYSSESVSSGYLSMSPFSAYSSDESFLPVVQETMDTDNYELFDPRHRKHQSPQRYIRKRNQKPEVSSLTDEDEDKFYESVETPFGYPLQHSTSAPVATASNESNAPVSKASNGFQSNSLTEQSFLTPSATTSTNTSCYPSDQESSADEYSEFDDDVSVIENIRFPIYSGGTGVRITEIREDKDTSVKQEVIKQHLVINKSKHSAKNIDEDKIPTVDPDETHTMDRDKMPTMDENKISKDGDKASTTLALKKIYLCENLLLATNQLNPDIDVQSSSKSIEGNFCSTLLSPTPPPRKGESCMIPGNLLTNQGNNQMEDLFPPCHNKEQPLQPLFSQTSQHQQIIQEKPIQFPSPLVNTYGLSSLPYDASRNFPISSSSRYCQPSDANVFSQDCSAPLLLSPAPPPSLPGTSPSSSLSKCPHCYIHSWLPHSLNCPKLKLNKNK